MITGVKQRTFQCLISNDIVHKEIILNNLVIQHLIIIIIIIICVSYEIMFTISLPNVINIAPISTCVIRQTL